MENEGKKYELTGETKKVEGVTLHRIRALRDIPRQHVQAGDLGGWIQSEKNLNQEGDAWVSGEAHVFENAVVSGNAQIYNNAQVLGSAKVSGSAWIYGNALVCGDVKVSENAHVYDSAEVCGHACVSGSASVSMNAWVRGNAVLSGHAQVCGNAWIYGNAVVSGHAVISGEAQVLMDAEVTGGAEVHGHAEISGDTWTCSPLYLQGSRHSVCTPDHEHIQVGCKILTPEEWQKGYRRIGQENGYTAKEIREYKLLIDVAAAWLKSKPWAPTRARKAA